MGRSPMCKTCVSYAPNDDGTIVCEYSGRTIDANSKPPFDDPSCYERKQKRKLTLAELSAIRSAAGKKGGAKTTGRKQKHTIEIDKIDYDLFARYASKVLGKTLVAAFHEEVVKIVEKHPELKPPEWIDERKADET